MKFRIILLTIFLSACQQVKTNDPNSLLFSMPAGSVLSLNKKMIIPKLYSHGDIQFGKAINEMDIDDYHINCRLDFMQLGPRTIKPQNFIVSRTEDGQNWVSNSGILRFYTEVYLVSKIGTDVIEMVCQQYGDQLDHNFSVADMQKALDGYIQITFAKK